MAKLFTEAELEELRRADAQLEEEYRLTPEDMSFSRKLDQEAKLDRLDNREKKIAAQQAAWQKNNRDKWNAYQRAYRAKKKLLPGVRDRETAEDPGDCHTILMDGSQ